MDFERLGAGAPLLVLLPSSTGPNGPAILLERLAEFSDVHNLEPGHLAPGMSNSKSASALSGVPVDDLLKALADEVVAWMDGLGIGAAHFLCHSTGCGIGQSLAARFPERIGKLVLVTPWAHADPHLHNMQTLRKAAARALDPEQYARFNEAILFPPEYRRRHERGFAQIATSAQVTPQDPVAISRRLDAILAFDAREVWGGIHCPTLVVASRDDQLMPSWGARATAEGIANAELAVLDGGGHMLPETRPDELAGLIHAFLLRPGV